MTFSELEARLGGKDSVKLSDKATTIRRDGADCIAVKYYNTDIVKYYSDNSCAVATDGMRLQTLKKRINKFLPDGYKLYQKNSKWVLKAPDGESDFSDYTRFDITRREDKIGKELDKKVYAEALKDNNTMEKKVIMPKKTYTLEEATIAHAKAKYMRFCGDLLEQAGGMGGPSAPQDDPAAAPTGTFPAPGASPNPDNQVQGPKTSDTGMPGADAGGKSQEIADEIYELMKEEGDTSEGFLVKYFEAKGYKAEDVKSALKQLEDEGKLQSRSTYMLSVEDDGGDAEKDGAGVTPGTTEPDMEEPAGAGAGGPPGAGAEGSAMAPTAMRNAMKNYMNGEDEDAGFDGEDAEMDDNDEMDNLDDEELEGDEDDLPDLDGGGEDYGPEHEEEEMDTVAEIEDDVRDAQALLKSIMSRINNMRGEHPNETGSRGSEDVAAMRNRKTGRYASAKNPMRRNPMMDDSDFGNYPSWGERRRGR